MLADTCADVLVSGCGDLEPEMQDTRTVILNMDFDQRSSSRTSSFSPADLGNYQTHLIMVLTSDGHGPDFNKILSNSSYWDYRSNQGEYVLYDSDRKITLNMKLNTKMKIFAFLFTENYSHYERPLDHLFSAKPEAGYYGESQILEILDPQPDSLEANIILNQVPGTGIDTGGGGDPGDLGDLGGGDPGDLGDPGFGTDTTPPANTSISINSNADNATSTSVTLAISATDNVGVTGYYASESSTILEDSASWTSVTSTTSYSANVSFTLSSVNNEIKTVYIWFKDSAGNISSPASDTIRAVYYYWKLIARQVDGNGDGSFSNDELFKNYVVNGVTKTVKDTFLKNADDSDSSAFMSIGNLNESSYDDTVGKYKFKLVWGGKKVDDELTIKEVIWTQTSWLDNSTITGNVEISNSGFPTTNTIVVSSLNRFTGLGKSGSNQCVIDGNGSTTNWWNCVGAINTHTSNFFTPSSTGIPGPLQKIASSMHLYIWSPGNL